MHPLYHRRFGGCYATAIAMARKFRWNIGYLLAYRNDADIGKKEPHIVHAWGITEEGRYVDALGLLSKEEIKDIFLGDDWEGEWFLFCETDEEGFIERMRLSYGDAEWFDVSYRPRFDKDIMEAVVELEEHFSIPSFAEPVPA